MFNKLKQFKDLRNQAKDLEQKLSQETVTGTAAFGKFAVTMNGNQKVQQVTIDPAIIGDKDKLESAAKDAFNDAQDKMRKQIMIKMQKGEIQMPNMG